MLTKVFAALGLLICVLLAVDMALPRRYQLAWRGWLRRGFGPAAGSFGSRLSGMGLRFNSRERRRAAHDAARDAIARAKQRAAKWDGNVYHGDEFEQRQRRKPH
ncbi:hypothetical protein SAMN05216359_102576 [Roseateles sp. YR242]|uniref:hypothetical protein n=1 Tax=Roseateles sp. YR242 TaxID=1855305 RepID=UPI0008C9BB70|nr:hypothetical protein [Roseateles sp. YR242]SEK65768.1 hypothetical protein SAMN05216359_102576 [Roseateles sp. YR242]